MRTLLVLDIDKTICDSRPTEEHLPAEVGGNYQPWWNKMNTTPLRVVRGSREGVQALLDEYQPVKVLFLTSRNECLYHVTAEWIRKNFPDLEVNTGRFASLSMRRDDDTKSPLLSKQTRLARYKYAYSIDRVVVVDDEPWAAELATGKDDRFIQIRNCKWEKKVV